VLLDKLKALVAEPPPAMAFEISEAGIAASRTAARSEIEFRPLKPGTLTISPLRENIADEADFEAAVRALTALQPARKRKDAALILPDFCSRVAVLDFDHFPSDAKEQTSLVRFRLKRAVPFDVESAALSYFVQTAGKSTEVVVVVAPLEIVSRYEAPFRAAGINPGLVTTSSLATLELLPDGPLTVLAKLSGHVLTVVVRQKTALKLVRCIELPAPTREEILAVLVPTLVYVEDNLGRAAESLLLCGFGAQAADAAQYFERELGVETGLVESPFGAPGEHNAGLLGYLRSVGGAN